MKFEIVRTTFLKALQSVSSVINPKSPKPEWTRLRIEVSGDTVELAGTSGEISLVSKQKGVNCQDGVVLVQPTRIIGFLKESGDSSVSCELRSNGQLVVKDSRAKANLLTDDPEKFVKLSLVIGDKYHELAVESLVAAVRSTIYAVSDGGAMFALCCLSVEADAETLTMFGCDARRGAVMTVAAEAYDNHHPKPCETLVPAKAAGVMVSAIDGIVGRCKVACIDNNFIVDAGNVIVSIRLGEGRHFNWRDAIPAGEPNKIDLATGAFVSVLRQVAVATDIESREVAVTLATDKMSVVAMTKEVGDCTVEMPISYAGTPLTFKVNNKFFADAFSALPGDRMAALLVVDPNSNIVIRSGEYLAFVAPLDDRDVKPDAGKSDKQKAKESAKKPVAKKKKMDDAESGEMPAGEPLSEQEALVGVESGEV